MEITQISCTQDYVAWTQTVALYLDADISDNQKELYPVYGLIDEVGEVAGMLKRVMRDSVPLDVEKFKLELGDVAWYLARLHYDHHGHDLNENNAMYGVGKELNILHELDRGTCFDTAVYLMEYLKSHLESKKATVDFVLSRASKHSGIPERLRNESFFLRALDDCSRGSEAIENSESAKFVMAMSQRIHGIDVASLLVHMVAEVTSTEAILTWICLCYRYNYDVMDVLRSNVVKLESRKERGTLHGKGSER